MTKKLAKYVECEITSSFELVKCLKSKTAELIVITHMYFYKYLVLPTTPFGPVLESNTEDAFFPEHPIKLMMQKKMADVPWVCSTTTDEGVIITGGKLCDYIFRAML